uniref:Uncharacterized protein n=1 Tax=Vespula pensylvanica TaxID=30213 RepID=A0A834JRK9_VESPE|nr:hypothetical protein H0235_017096 [Vespula pensylvanica]
MSTEVMAEEGQRFLGEKESFEKSARNSESGNGRSSNRMRKEGGRASTAGVWAETTSGNVIAPRIQKGNRDRACRKRESNLLFVVCCQYRVSSNNSSSSDKFALLQILLKILESNYPGIHRSNAGIMISIVRCPADSHGRCNTIEWSTCSWQRRRDRETDIAKRSVEMRETSFAIRDLVIHRVYANFDATG